MHLGNVINDYAMVLREKVRMGRRRGYTKDHEAGDLLNDCPKAVLAAIAVSYASQGGDYLDKAADRVLREWWILHRNGIVPQRPSFPEPEPEDE